MKSFSWYETVSVVICIGLLLFSCSATQAEENELAKRVLRDWKELTDKLQICSGTVEFSGKVAIPGARSPKDRTMDFASRGRLMKVMASDEKEDTHYLWNSHGSFIVYKPKEEPSWILGKSEPALAPGERVSRSYSPRNFLIGGVCVLSVPLLDLLKSTDYEITSCESVETGEIRIDLKYLPGMVNFNYRDRSAWNRTPFFDTIEVYVDPEHLSRIMRYSLVRTTDENKRGWTKGNYTYSEELPLIPEMLTIEGGPEGRQTPTVVDNGRFRFSMEAPPAAEFELEHYGIKTPYITNPRSLWYFYLLIAVAILFLGRVVWKMVAR